MNINRAAWSDPDRGTFAAAEQSGLYPVFCAENAAMALLLLGSTEEACRRVEAVMPSLTGVFMRAQALALLAWARILEGSAEASSSIAELEAFVKNLNSMGVKFDISQSPLLNLMQGLSKSGKYSEACAKVGRVLQGDFS